eukprot:scaffold18682_cov50-Phaeocystis_antarctica.AAC.3
MLTSRLLFDLAACELCTEQAALKVRAQLRTTERPPGLQSERAPDPRLDAAGAPRAACWRV